MAKTPKPGDIFQLKTPKGFAYIQYTHRDDEYGQLIRVLPGLFDVELSSFDKLSQKQALYFVFFPLSAAVSRGILTRMTNEPIPESAQSLPIMKRPGTRDSDGKVLSWWIKDGKSEKKVEKLNDKQRRYSLAVIWNDTLLVDRICSGWLPENES